MGDPTAYDGGALLLLEEQLRREMSRLEDRRRELDASRQLLERLTSRALGAHEPISEPLSDALAPSVVSRLLTETSGLLRNFVLTIDEGPAFDEATMRANEERIRRGDAQRAVYPASALSTPQGHRWMSGWAEAGEDQRILPATDTEFAVFGDTAVVAMAGWDDPALGYAVIRDPLVVRLYTAYFDIAWKHAIPAPAVGRDSTGDPKLVELLELGLKDEAIARYLGVSLRTVRRRVAHLMAVNGVDTRFQLGWALARGRR
ncbi:MAG TPA: hypothetical protein VFN34_08785 [Ornithinibacter sp.]|nr:hypothetical protein [Ornithinibacter sp.]